MTRQDAERRYNGPKTGRFNPGNPGRPHGARNKATITAEKLLDGEAEQITRKCIEMAKAGETVAMRLCMDRIASPKRSRPIAITLPSVATADGVAAAVAALVVEMAAGNVAPDEAATIASVFECQRRMIETADLAERIAALEKAAHGPNT